MTSGLPGFTVDAVSTDPSTFILDVVRPPIVVVINLDRRPERWRTVQAAWHPDLASRFVRFSATDGREMPADRVTVYMERRRVSIDRAAGELGCLDSWIRAVSEHGAGLYLEDDACPCAPWACGPPPDDAEIVLLGGQLWEPTSEPGWISAGKGVNGTQAVWIRTQRAADELLASWQPHNEATGPVDFVWRSALSTCRTVLAVPQIVCQIDLDTDVQIGRVFGPWETTLVQPWCSLKDPPR